jgi:heme exporter protein D
LALLALQLRRARAAALQASGIRHGDCRPCTPVRNLIDFTSWLGVLSTLLGIAVFSLVAVGIRLLLMQTVQQRRERENRQINERLKTLIAAYKTLGGSFTGDLAVDPRHWRELREARIAGLAEELEGDQGGEGKRGGHGAESGQGDQGADQPAASSDQPAASSDRRRRMRDAVEAALSDVLLLGTEDQVRLAARAAEDMVAGRAVETAELVVSLRTFIRDVLDLDPLPAALSVPRQGPLRPAAAGGSRGGRGERAGAGGASVRGGGRQGGGDGSVGLATHGGVNMLRGEEAPDATGPGAAAP